MADDGAYTRMAEHYRRLGFVERVHHRRLAHMAEIDQHPQPVHLAHYLAAEVGQPAMQRRVGRAVGPAQPLGVCEREVTHTQVIGLAEHGQALADRIAALHPKHRRDLAALHGRSGFVGGAHESELVGVARHHALHDVDLFQHRHHRLGLG